MYDKKYVPIVSSLGIVLIGLMLFGGSILGEASPEKSPPSLIKPEGIANQEILSEVTIDDKPIALTFDDGPDETTEPMLDVLKVYGVKATFFVVGENCRQRPETVRRMFRAGHEIGNHTYTHLKFRGKTQARIEEEIAKTNEVIYELTGQTPQLFRPPGGTMNENIKAAASRENVKIVLWSPEEDSKDWRNPGVGWIVKNVTDHAKEGSIVLMHDGGGPRQQTLKSLPLIIEALRERGYQFVTVSELLQKRVKTMRPEEPIK